MKFRLLQFGLISSIIPFLLFGYSIQDNPNNDTAPTLTETGRTLSLQMDTIPPVGFPYPTQFSWNYSAIPGVNGGTVGAIYFNGKYYMNRWNNAVLYRYNANGPGGGPGTLADSITGYNGGTGAIRDLTAAPDGSGRMYLWGGSAGTALYKLDSLGTRVASYTHTGAAYRAITWDPNRKGFWSSNFGDNIVCRDTNGVIKRTITSTIAGKYGMGFDSTSSPDSAFLWVWSQVTGGLQNQLDKIYLGTGLSVKTYLFNTIAASVGIAGGAEVVIKDNQLLLLLNFQTQAVCGYKIKDFSITANFNSDVQTINQGQTVNYIDSSYGAEPITSWSWSFPGGVPSSSTDRNPVGIRYYSPGSFSVSLTAYSANYSNTITKTNFITVIPGCIATWKHKIKIRDSGVNDDSLKYGMAYSATNGLDTCLGELAVPPPPPTGVFDCRFILPTNDASKIDIRQDANVDLSWKMSFQPSSAGYPITFSWNVGTLPSFGTFILKDEITGTLINVNMRNQSSYVLNLSGISSMKIDYYYSRTLTSSVSSGWNIVSVPVRAPDMTYSTLFPGVNSQAYTYNNGYTTINTLSNGAGYWMKFNNANNYLITGYKYQPENMYVSSGWNLIGPFDSNFPVSSIVSNPSGIVNSYYFGYGGSYAIADTLKVGKGYWIRTSASGYLYKGVMDNIQTQPAANPLEQFAELRLTSGKDEHAILFLGMANELTSDYTLPPIPPSGIFDVRFGTDKFVEELGRNHVLKINSASRETKLTVHNTKGAKFRVKDAIDGSIIDKELVEGAEIIIPANLGTLLLETSAVLPLTYELSQNYPNPFNPVTTIKYQIPDDGLVKLVVFDVLGREVKTLVNGNQTAGSYEVRLDASSLASGVYFYRLVVSPSNPMTSGNFEDLKKLVVLK